MSYFADLSPHTHDGAESDEVLNVGWLDQHHSYTQGGTSVQFRQRLEVLCKNTPLPEMDLGYHACEFCGRWLGRAVLTVQGARSTFEAPVLVYHYVVAHNYRPPEEFIEAVLEAPLPGSVAHAERFGRLLGCGLRECHEDMRPEWNGDA